MTTDHHDQHDETSYHHRPDPVSQDPSSGRPSPGRPVADQRDFWGDGGDWTTPVHAEPDDTTGTLRRPGGLLGTLGAWADRTLSSGVEPTRSHRAVGTTTADPAVDTNVIAGASAPLARRTPTGEQPHHLDRYEGTRHHGEGYGERHHHDPVDDDRYSEVDPGVDATRTDERWDDERWDDGWSVAPVAEARSGVDPLLARLGGLAVVLTLLVPLLLGMRSGGDDQLGDDGIASVETASTGSVASVPSVAPEATSTDTPVETADGGTDTLPATTPAAVDTDDASDDAAGTEPVASSSALGADATTTVTTVQAIGEPAQADDSGDGTEPVCASEYEVVAGDFWLRLAEAAAVDLDDLLAVNGASIDTPLFPGRSICLPAGARTPAPPTTAAPATAPATQAPTTAAPTTAAPTTAAPTTAAPATPPPSSGDVEQIIRDVWPDDLEERALEIAWRESNYVPTAKNFCCYGVFQIYWEVHRGWLADLGVTTADQLYDPATNARAALELYRRAGGWGPWGF